MPKSIKGVYSTAEILYDWQREAIEKAFGCTVYNQYGSREIPNIGLQCRHGNYHTFTDMVYLESIEELAEKKFIISSLTNQTMPFIRYDIGDSGRLKAGECSCGSPFPMIEMGFCRSNDIITLANNQKIYPSWFIHLLDGVDGINQYQFVQTKPEQMVLYLDAEKPLSPQQQEMIQQRVQDKFADQLCLTIQMTDQISRTSSGKRRFVISL
jgi:phenylacetate-CoA ligase